MARFNTKRETLQRERERKGYVVSPKKENERVLEREAILVSGFHARVRFL